MYLDANFLVRMGSALTTDTIKIKLMIYSRNYVPFIYIWGFQTEVQGPQGC